MNMLIAPDSPLRRPPVLEGRERLFVDGVRYAIDMGDFAFSRLRDTLLRISIDADAQGLTQNISPHGVNVAVLLDAWSMVDAVDRLRGLLGTRGKILKGFPSFNAFQTKTASVRQLRNYCDHLGQRLDQLASRNMPVHGVVSWFARLPNGNAYIGLFKGGTFSGKTEDYPIVNPFGKQVHVPIGMVTLQMGTDSVCLSDVFDELRKLVAATEPELTRVFSGAPAAGGDFTGLLKLGPAPVPQSTGAEVSVSVGD